MNQATTKSRMAAKQSQFKNVVRGFSLVLHDQRVALQNLIMPGNDKAFKNVARGFSLVLHDRRGALPNLEANSWKHWQN